MTASAVPRACVIGWPVRHSRSPIVHGFWLRTLRIEGAYVHAETEPQRFEIFIRSLATEGFVGANVTIPFKEAAFRLCDHVSPVGAALGAVNTLWLTEGKLHGDNTDVAGFLHNLDEGASGWSNRLRKAVVLGAGGAARAVLHGLLERGAAHIVLVNRTRARAHDLLHAMGDGAFSRIELADWPRLPEVMAGADFLVNTTSLGMHGQPPLDVDLSPLPSHACVADIVYVPIETPLLAAARMRGLRTVDGLGMLLHQAVPGFERWFGVRPQVTPQLRHLVAADIARTLAPRGA